MTNIGGGWLTYRMTLCLRASHELPPLGAPCGQAHKSENSMGGMRLRTDFNKRGESAAEASRLSHCALASRVVLRSTSELLGGMVAFISSRQGIALASCMESFPFTPFGLEHPQLMQELRRSGAAKVFKQHPHLFTLKDTDRGWAPRGSPNSDLSAVHGTQSLKQMRTLI